MALSPKPLGSGQLPAAKGTLYTVPAVTTTLLTRGRLVNVGAADVTLNIYLKTAAGTSKRILPQDMTLMAGQARTIPGGDIVDAGGLIEGDASIAASVDYYLSGVEIT